ncbi:MAG: SRPBCC family protein [Marinomonas hwangdonensis]|nr:SRPBCC family protein [Marinomonas hwangdonensis]
MQFEEQIIISAPVEKVFALYANVKGWSSWDPDVKASSIEGAFVSGANGTLEPSKGPKAKIAFTEVVPNRSFTVKSKLPLCVMSFEHELSENSEKTKAVHRVTFDGLLSPLFGRLIGSQISKGLPNTLQGLKHAAEHQS